MVEGHATDTKQKRAARLLARSLLPLDDLLDDLGLLHQERADDAAGECQNEDQCATRVNANAPRLYAVNRTASRHTRAGPSSGAWRSWRIAAGGAQGPVDVVQHHVAECRSRTQSWTYTRESSCRSHRTWGRSRAFLRW